MERLRAKAPPAEIYFTTHGSGAIPVLRLRAVVRGERASRSIVNRRTGFWSIWIVASLILAGSGLEPFFEQARGTEVADSRGSNGISKIAQ